MIDPADSADSADASNPAFASQRRESDGDVGQQDLSCSTNHLVPATLCASNGQTSSSASFSSSLLASQQLNPVSARQLRRRSKSHDRLVIGSYEGSIIFQPITPPPNQFDSNDTGLVCLLENNQRWANAIHAERPQFFYEISLKQEPKLLWIGCSDSRVPANQIVHLGPGEVFVHRNIANIVTHTDLNCLSVLQYAVEVLKVEHVIVCGHYRCGGVSASMHKHQHGLIDNWLRCIKDVYHANKEILSAIKDEAARERKLVELNVENSTRNVAHSSIVQNAWKTGQRLRIHSWVYDLETGFINSLPLCINSLESLDDIYSYE